MNHRVRHSLGWDIPEEKLSGIIEADEHFTGGKEKNRHKSKKTEGTQDRSTETKTPIAGLVQRHSINKAHLASKMEMPAGTFKNKLSDKQTAYRFTDEELETLKAILRDMTADIEIVAGISFNKALSSIVNK